MTSLSTEPPAKRTKDCAIQRRSQELFKIFFVWKYPACMYPKSYIYNHFYHIKYIYVTVLNAYLNAVCPAVALDRSNVDHLIILGQMHWKSYSAQPKLSSEQ